jgi:GH24 family phage-related lysozyme (muramidase)
MVDDKSIVEDGSLKVDKAKKRVTDLFIEEPAMKDVMGLDEQKTEETREMTKTPLPEATEAVNDVPNPDKWHETKDGTVSPQFKAGKAEEPMADSDMARFANQGTPDYEGDKADFAPETTETGKKVRGHKTKSGL